MGELIDKWNEGYAYSVERDCLLVKMLRDRGLTEEQIESVLEVLGDVCLRCWDHERKYRCLCEYEE